MNHAVILAQLFAVRNVVDALIVEVQTEAGQPPTGACAHLGDSEPVGNFGDPRRICRTCGALFEPAGVIA